MSSPPSIIENAVKQRSSSVSRDTVKRPRVATVTTIAHHILTLDENNNVVVKAANTIVDAAVDSVRYAHDRAIDIGDIVVDALSNVVKFAGRSFKLTALRSNLSGKKIRLASVVFPTSDLVKLPPVLDYRHEMMAVRQQGNKPICVGETGATISEWQHFHETDGPGKSGEMLPMSSTFIYEHRENKNSDGMSGEDLMRILKEVGSCPQVLYEKYCAAVEAAANNKEYLALIKEEILKETANYRIASSALIDTIDAFKVALYKNGPCPIIFPCYNASTTLWRQADPTQKLLGGHCVTCVGYTESGFIIRNSWSSAWGSNGYCIFPYSDWGQHWDAWTAVDASSALIDSNKISTSICLNSCGGGGGGCIIM